MPDLSLIPSCGAHTDVDDHCGAAGVGDDLAVALINVQIFGLNFTVFLLVPGIMF